MFCFGCLTSTQWLLAIVAFLFYIYRLLTRNHDFFLKRGVKFLKPSLIFGNMGLYSKISFPEMFFELYNTFTTESFFGFFEFYKPIYIIRDPDIIKQVTVKDFDNFVDHRSSFDESIEPVFDRGLFFMRSQKWRDMRATLSPAFTGSKMRQMFTLIVDCSKNTAKHIIENAKENPLELEMKDIFTRFSTDVIGTCAFGVTTDSLTDRENEFYRMGKELTSFDGIIKWKFFFFSFFPKLMKFLRIPLFRKKLVEFFRNLVQGAMKYRFDNNISRPDMIHLLMRAKQGSLTHDDSDKKLEEIEGFATVQESEVGKSTHKLIKWEDDDLTAQCVLFFLAGFDTVSTLMCFMSYELAINPDIQEKLIEEVDAVKEELNGKPITYEVLQKMKYMDMTISESLRKWPPAPFLDRYCTKEAIIENSDGNKVKINPKDGIWFPIFGLQNDPKYFPNPKKFDPERFSIENKGNIKPFTYIPFGVGPRNCIGSRFALMETKAVFYEILSELTIELSPKSQHPIKFKKNNYSMQAEKGFWVQYRKREK